MFSKKYIPYINIAIKENSKKHKTHIIGIYDTKEEAINGLIRYVIINCEYYNNEYGMMDFYEIKKIKEENIEELIVRFKSSFLLQKLLENKYHNGLLFNWYYDIEEVNN